jgi:hypothetical protein
LLNVAGELVTVILIGFKLSVDKVKADTRKLELTSCMFPVVVLIPVFEILRLPPVAPRR